MFLALFALSCGRWLAVGVWTACALLTKPQAAAMLPVLLVVLSRHLPRSAAFFGGALITGVAILAPFYVGGALDAVFAVYQRTVGGYYNGVSIGAHNFWAIFHRTARLSDDELALNLISFRSAGLMLLTVATLAILWRLKTSLIFPRTQREHLLGVLLAGALTTSAMFIFATEMHERYQFAYILLALPIAAVSRRGAMLYVATSALIFLNLLGSLAFGPVPAAIFPKIVGVLQVVLFLLTVRIAPNLIADDCGNDGGQSSEKP
jgi:Gpi18-like mannosyltransferase